MFLACYEASTHFSFSIRIDDNFLIKIYMVIQLHTYSGLCILSQKCEFLGIFG